MTTLTKTTNTGYNSWDFIELTDWIISIDPSFEEKYKQILLRSLTQNAISGKHINNLDREDLTKWGIINLDDKRKIYNAIQTLIVTAKRCNSMNTDHVTSLSDDEEEEEDKDTLLTEIQRQQLTSNGYCMLQDPLTNHQILHAVQGYIRNNFSSKYMIPELMRTIINYYHSRYNIDLYLELVCTNIDDDTEHKSYETFLVPKRNIALSGFLSSSMDFVGNKIEIDDKKVSTENMHHVLRYLGHHKGIKPEEIAKPIRSVRMERIVSDKWDADYINSCTKKSIFQIILAANYLDCASLLHLGSAKIATLIKGKSPEEIKNILADK